MADPAAWPFATLPRLRAEDMIALGLELGEIMPVGGWKSPAMPARYGERLWHNAARLQAREGSGPRLIRFLDTSPALVKKVGRVLDERAAETQGNPSQAPYDCPFRSNQTATFLGQCLRCRTPLGERMPTLASPMVLAPVLDSAAGSGSWSR